MQFTKQIEIGVRTYISAVSFIFLNGFWWVFIFPFIVATGLYVGGYSILQSYMDTMQRALLNLIGINVSLPASGFIYGIVATIIHILFFIFFAYVVGYIVLILMTPLFTYLSERTEEIITGNIYPFRIQQFLKDMWRGAFLAIRNFFIQFAWMVGLFIFGLIPVMGWLSPLFFFLVSSYFYGFSFIDYTSERRKLTPDSSINFVRQNKWLAIIHGAVYSVFLLIPIIGILLSCFAAIISVVAATLAINELVPIKTKIEPNKTQRLL